MTDCRQPTSQRLTDITSVSLDPTPCKQQPNPLARGALLTTQQLNKSVVRDTDNLPSFLAGVFVIVLLVGQMIVSVLMMVAVISRHK
jgi:hypothetical protein